jgi:hypothetical protein
MIRTDVSTRLDDGGLVCGNPEKHLGPTILSYIDILGFSNALMNNWGAHPESALHKLLRIKATIPSSDEKTQIPIALVNRETDKTIERYLTITRTLSDSVITMAALPDICEWESFYCRVYSVLFSIRLIWQQAIREGFTIRGVVELGDLFWNELEIIGPVLVTAYNLEKKVKTSRVIFGPNLLKNILTAFDSSGWPIDHGSSPINSMYCSDGLIAVNPRFIFAPNNLPLLEEIMNQAGENAYRYVETIRLLKENDGSIIKVPTIDDIKNSIKNAEALLKDKEL